MVAEQHYNTDNAMFARMLGPTMNYSCGYWKDAETLDEAQRSRIVDGQERLAALQQEPDSPEALAAIPHVQLSDLPRDPAPIPTEAEADGRLILHAVQTDAAREAETFAAFGIPAPDVLAFPEGAHTTLTDVVLRECGYKVTLTTDESRVNTVVVGLPQTLIDLGRMTVLPGMTDEQLLQYLNERAN